MRQKLVSFGNDFWIENQNGQKVFKVDGKMLRVRDTLFFEDARGQKLCKIQTKVMRIKDSMEIEGADGGRLAMVKKALITPLRDRWVVAGKLPQALSTIALPQVSISTYVAMIFPAIGIFLVAYSEALGVAREFAEKHGYEVDPDQELNAHAFTNLVSGLFGGMIAAGGMSASAVKDGAGAQTQIANLVAWGVTLVTLLFLNKPAASGLVGASPRRSRRLLGPGTAS